MLGSRNVQRRFPAMQHYLDNQLGFTEQDYLNYEQLARNLDQQYGLPGNMIYNAVTDLLVNEIGAEELAAAPKWQQRPLSRLEDFKETMRNYGITRRPSGLLPRPRQHRSNPSEGICGLNDLHGRIPPRSAKRG